MVRPSHVRDAVKSLLQIDARHDWTVEAVLAALRKSGVAADFSSVFRSLVFLEDSGVIRRVDLGDGKRRYEVEGPHHEHVRCDRCGAVAPIPECRVPVVSTAAEDSSGYSIRGHELLFRGLCGPCLTDPPRSTAPARGPA